MELSRDGKIGWAMMIFALVGAVALAWDNHRSNKAPTTCEETFNELRRARHGEKWADERAAKSFARAIAAEEDNAKLRAVIDLKERQRVNLEAALKAERAK